MKKQSCEINPRLNRVGGEAVLEGVMMKAGNECPTAVRMPNGAIRVLPRQFHSVKEKIKILGLPIIRGVIGFIETMKLSLSVMTASAEVVMDEELKKEGQDKSSGKLMGFVSAIAMILGVVLALGLFLYLPNLASEGINAMFVHFWNIDLGIWKAVPAGVLRVIIFALYIFFVSFMPDIKRTFQYHGAEHKTIACFEAGEELTPANAKRHSRFHPRCGTSFMFVMILIGIILSIAARAVLVYGFHVDFVAVSGGNKLLETLMYVGIGLVLLPLIMGIGYEFLMFAGKHCSNPIVKILSAPGLWMQRLTTREPSEEQLEVAIAATMYALPDLYPDFDRAAYASEEGYLAPVEIEFSDESENADDGETAETAEQIESTTSPDPDTDTASEETQV